MPHPLRWEGGGRVGPDAWHRLCLHQTLLYSNLQCMYVNHAIEKTCNATAGYRMCRGEACYGIECKLRILAMSILYIVANVPYVV